MNLVYVIIAQWLRHTVLPRVDIWTFGFISAGQCGIETGPALFLHSSIPHNASRASGEGLERTEAEPLLIGG